MAQADSVRVIYMKQFPDSLRAATPVAGHALARQMAEFALAERSTSQHDMAAHLSAPPPAPVETLTAIYFQTVATANASWQR